jgi:transposase InsO family protein
MKEHNTKLARWALKLTEYDFTVHHIPGSLNRVPDALSRLPSIVKSITLEQDFSEENLAKLQAKDPELSAIIHQKRTALLPAPSPSQRHGVNKRYIQLWHQLVLQNNLLFRAVSQEQRLLIVPSILRRRVVQQWHEQGHIGVSATASLLRERYYWPGMEADVQEHVSSCLVCNRRKQWQERPQPPQRTLSALQPMECWAMDFVGPLPVTTRGNKYILTMIDSFTRWTEAIALPDQSASGVAQAIVSQIVSIHGVPHKILTDQGRNFESNLVNEVTKLLGINKVRTTPYHPQGNGMCEKFNGTLKNILATMVNSDGNDWDSCLSMALWFYRTKPHSATGASPFEMLFGRQPRHIPELYFPQFQTDGIFLTGTTYLETLKRRIKSFHQAAENKSIDLQLAAPPRKPPIPLCPGDQVLLEKGQRKHTFDNRFEGPFPVMEQVDAQNVILQKDEKPYRVHRQRLKRLPKRLSENNLLGAEYDSFFRGGKGRR